jgi:hypothetical protein
MKKRMIVYLGKSVLDTQVGVTVASAEDILPERRWPRVKTGAKNHKARCKL